MFLKALLIAFYAGFVTRWTLPGYWGSNLIACPIIGLILGDFQMGMLCGGTLQLAWMGLVMIGSAVPPDTTIGGIVGTSFAILTGGGPETALAVGIPAALISQQLKILAMTITSWLCHVADSFAEKADVNKVMLMNWMGLVVYGLVGFIPTFLALYFGTDAVNAVLSAMPKSLMAGLSIAGGLLPAVGFAMLLRAIAAKHLFYFLFAGFALATHLKLGLIPIAIFGICAGVAYVQLSDKGETA